MALQGITLFLERFKKLKAPEKYVKEAVQKAVQDICLLTIPVEQISVSKKGVFISTHPLIRTKIHLDKESIEKKIEEYLVKKINIH